MKTERDLFEEWFTPKYLFNYLYWSEEQKNYVYNQYDGDHCKAYECVNSSWSAWCASAQRDGYKLVPLRCANNMAHAAKEVDGRLSVFKYGDVWEAMIGAAE